MAAVSIDSEKCCGCTACTLACPFGALAISEGKAVILDNCIACGACLNSCPIGAISEESRVQVAPARCRDLWVLAEQKEGCLREISRELLGEGARLARAMGQDLCALLLGDDVGALARELISYGAQRVYLAQDPLLAHYQTGPYTDVIFDLVRRYAPSVILIGATSAGRDLAPRLAARLCTGLTADCTGLRINDDGLLAQTRPAFGGNIMAEILCPDRRPQMATVRPHVFAPPTPDTSRHGEIINVSPSCRGRETCCHLLRIINETADMGLEDADIIVAGGRGLGNAENFLLLRELAARLGGRVGASRAAVDAGWISAACQIGQTGRTVRPRLYIACGISGAVQHLAGMQSSGMIIAINRDPAAPIFGIAHYGVIGDLRTVIPALTRNLTSPAE